MPKNLFKYFLLIPAFLYLPTSSNFAMNVIDSEDISIKSLLNKRTMNFEDIDQAIILNNLELKALREQINSASFNLKSKIAKRYPTLDLTANGLPQYLYSENKNNWSVDTKSSQFKINPSLNLRWNLIDPQRAIEIRTAKNNFEIAKNNFEIKKSDLIKKAKSRYHKYQKSSEIENNAKIAVDLSVVSLSDAQAKLDIGIGTKFDVLEASAQLARDKQLLKEKNIAKEINLIALKEILNVELDEKLLFNKSQKITGFWPHPLEKNLISGLKNSYSLKNRGIQISIKNDQAQSFRNANLPLIYISNSLSSSFTKGSTLSPQIEPSRSSTSYTNIISLDFRWNLSSGGQNKNSYKSKKADAISENFLFINLQNLIKKNISEAYLNLIRNQQKITSSEKEIIARKEALRLARLRYEVGLSTLKDILIRQKELTNAQSQKIDAIYNYNINLDNLERLTFQSKSKDCDKNNESLENQIYPICDY